MTSDLPMGSDDLSVEELLNEDLWTLDDCEAFCLQRDESASDDEEDDPFDWFHERGKIYDV